MSTDPTDPTNPTSNPSEDDVGFGAFGGSEGTGFDYAAFEDSLKAVEDATQEDLFTDPGMVEERVESRTTIDLRRIPQDDATYDTRDLGKYTVVTIRGRVNESFPGEAIGKKLRGSVIFDLTEVDRITSFGVRAWLQMLDLAKMKEAVFVRASPAVINQVTMMRNFCGPAKIHSLVAPYSCESCGNEFGVTYEAIGDRTALRARNPLLIECPQCRKGAELDEDPWVFFGIDDQLLETLSDDLAKVLENLGERPNHAPIEKSFHGDTTRVRFNGVVDGSTRFQRAFGGLEGKIAIDLRTTTGIDEAGNTGLYDYLEQLDPAISNVELEGCPLPLLEKLLEHPNPKLEIRSVMTEVHSERRGMSRPVLINLRRHRTPLRQGKIPDLDIPWRDEPITLTGLPLLTAAAKAILDVSATPPPVSQATPVSTVPTDHRLPKAVIPLASLVVFSALAFALVMGGGLIYSQSGGTVPITTAPQPAPSTQEGTWSTGGVLPPSWSERPYVNQSGTILLAGTGSGPTISSALERARKAALLGLLPEAETLLGSGLGDDLPASGPERIEAETRWIQNTAALPLDRTQEASRRTSDGQHEVAVQYSVPSTTFNAWLDTYDQTSQFRGLTLRPRPPWAKPGLQLVKRESYLSKGKPGDLLLTINGSSVATLQQLESTAGATFEALSPGRSLPFVFSREGEPLTIEFSKPRATVSRPSTVDTPPELDLPPELSLPPQ